MTEKEAIAYFKAQHTFCKCDSTGKCKKCSAGEWAISALEKQMPKKPNEKNIGGLKVTDTAFCPICDSPVIKDESDKYEQAYCCYCGQALDWSDKE